MEQVGIADPSEYLVRLYGDHSECDQLIGVLAVNVTSFFRDPVVFEVLAQSVLPDLVSKAARKKNREVRIWCAGCATGEEAYSVAILLDAALKNAECQLRPLVFGTDINENSLKTAERGSYRREKLENVKLGILDRYFMPNGEEQEVNREIKSMVAFSHDDLTAGERFAPAQSVFGGFDLMLCRNVLIYFTKELQETVLGKLHRSLDAGGVLVLGSAEFLGGPAAKGFRTMDVRNKIFRKTGEVLPHASSPSGEKAEILPFAVKRRGK
jgi:chemotaxis methyl-accepting protein methylase